MNSEHYLPAITLILSITTLLGPIVFSGALWRMAKVFVNKEQFEEFKRDRDRASEHLDKRLQIIEDDIKSLLAK